MNTIINLLSKFDWGTVPDWIGNVSIPIILALFSHKYTIQREKQIKESKKSEILKLQMGLLTLINNELPAYPDAQTFRSVLKNNLVMLEEISNTIFNYKDSNSNLLYPEFKNLIDIVKNNQTIGHDYMVFSQKILRDAVDALNKEYDYLNDSK